ncbi:MAG: adaptor protein MecA [Clostridia bacterium]|nr:adaptor protein MecA [Clostridia bacterium]
MEFLVVSKTKLKAILTPEDMKTYNLDGVEEYSGAPHRRSFREILKEAEVATGFKTGRDKVLIQLYPLREGGGELFVTRLITPQKSEVSALSGAQNVTMLSYMKRLYKFENLGILIRASKSLTDKSIPSEAYYIDGSFYLFTEEHCQDGYISDSARLSEFGERLPEKLIPYVKEQGREVLAKNAVKLLSAL